ncbi:SO2930 family diheme c-type cytochrome [Erythrobacter sp. THAF29]|uniref:SO2930 family diheme c-type cytochrome n=1 Tax=Erythrobacter sp. THAF29 TaxID=2587851 RepID=UPI001267F955|nr:SO2930 family diheme c-type cytochrome [Erythrobacter sp. THAF29]QFT77174.1 Cytochrome c [Erythrobacter sp. THAF29]
MRHSVVLLAASALAFGGAIAGGAVPPPVVVNDALLLGDSMPRTLEEFGFFRKRNGTDPAPGVVPYELNTPLYSDGADKLRYIYLPDGEQLVAVGDGLLQFPVGSAIIKTFAFGEGANQRFIETRVLLHRPDGWLALPYRWNDEQTEARLALAGARLPITRPDGSEISYRVPNKNQCKTCHSMDGEVIPIGPKARNLSKEWLAQMVEAGRLSEVPAGSDSMPDWAVREGADTAALARAYLDVNCAHCHQPGGGASNSGLDLRWEQDEPHALGIRKPPVAAGRGAGGHKVSIAPGDPDASILVYRMDSAEPGIAMPELGKSTVDEEGVAVVRKWIAEMKQGNDAT